MENIYSAPRTARRPLPWPWYYRGAAILANLAVVASVLTLIGGVTAGLAVASYTGQDAQGAPTTDFHGGVLAAWIVGSISASLVWLFFAVALKLLLDAARGRFSSR